MSKTIDVIIPAYKPGKSFPRLLEKLELQSLKPDRIIIVNTGEEYWKTLECAPEISRITEQYKNIDIYHISKEEFDHGNTRNFGVSKSRADIFVMMTHDAVPEGATLLEELTRPFFQGEDEKIAVSYARQLPMDDCNEAEKYTRSFNYPENNRIKSLEDIPTMGIKSFFCSNVCAAYRREIFDKFGGFTKKTIFNEDMIFAGTVVRAGLKIAYRADARVIHSHNYNWLQYFHRNFDLGVSQTDYPQVFGGIRSEGEGVRLVKATARHLKSIGCASQIPALIWNSGWKYMGFLLGRNYKKLPRALVVALSDNKKYWS